VTYELVVVGASLGGLRAMTDLLGFQPTWRGGAWTWNVRALVDNPNAILTGPDIPG